MLAGLANGIQQPPKADVLHTWKIRLGEIDAVDDLKIVGAKDHDFVAELI